MMVWNSDINPKFLIHIGHIGIGGLFGCWSPLSAGKWLDALVNKCLKDTKKFRKKPHILLIYGEATEGRNKNDYNEDIWLPRIYGQIDLVVDWIALWVTPQTIEVLIPYAHTYHGSKEFRVEDIIAEKLRAKGINAKAGMIFTKNFYGENYRFMHEYSSASVFKSSVKERKIKDNAEMVGHGVADLIKYEYTEHWHQMASAGLFRSQYTNVRCFKLSDTYAQQKPDKFAPDLGMVVTKFVRVGGHYYPLNIPIPHDTVKIPFSPDELQEQKRIWFKNNPRLKAESKRFQILENQEIKYRGKVYASKKKKTI